MAVKNTDDLLEFYRRELTYLRKRGADFAQKYPKVAGRLELGGDECPDPMVERLIEAFAFLSARIQHNLESEFPLVTSAILDILYPHFLEPVPSMTMAHFEVDPEQGELTTGHLIPKGTPLFAESEEGTVCRFRTCYPVTLWPVEVAYAGFESTDKFDFLDTAAEVASVLRIRISSDNGSLAETNLDRLRFYLSGDKMLVYELYEILFCNVLRVAILPEGAKRPVYMPLESLQPVGFGDREDVLPYRRYSSPGYRLLQEYFTFPEKFLFFDVENLAPGRQGSHFDLILMLDSIPGKRVVVDSETFRLGCTPVINLFSKTTEPIRLDERSSEYRLVPDARRLKTTEIHSINRVSASPIRTDETRVLQPYFSFDHHVQAEGSRAFWFSRRVPTGREDLPGTEMMISFVDLDFKPASPPDKSVFGHTLCTNRHLAEQLSDGALLQIELAAPLHRISCIGKPTTQIDPPMGGATFWRLISHLSLNYLSLSAGEESLKALKEILLLYSFSDKASTFQQVAGIREMEVRKVMRRLGYEAWRGFLRGLEVKVTFDESLYVGNSAFLLASVLNRFLSLYASVNSFTQLVIESVQREGVWKRWPPMAGEEIVL